MSQLRMSSAINEHYGPYSASIQRTVQAGDYAIRGIAADKDVLPPVDDAL